MTDVVTCSSLNALASALLNSLNAPSVNLDEDSEGRRRRTSR